MELAKIIKYIEGLYSRELSDKEISVLNGMLKNITLDKFITKYERTLINRIDYFTPSRLQQIINERKELEDWMNGVGIKDLNELYEN